ncbi:PAS domain S-box-containing protein/diguanylate cyclase (GGDEF) domain-containing protein [Noviherbaspirillum humi]|uniref:PAS domain S-box-containing protein/diguanylate cyclase (GGDEF) domain-containing protein n=1 Tax=Noviherbaspirillum humi TaxID=1688639 RepID=A0A239HQS1_9BURK|nr:EAL domain-containing protein [Noviherbaspirillum humi]SNS83636.1 PAS domain S-box-containing protein/diguanylate cyclase (GGDEF) domain-containing protein [Noviherbaspirillum humi]
MARTEAVDCSTDTHPSIDEPGRLAALRQYRILDTDPEIEFDDLTRLASALCGTPIALISLLDENRYWFKSRVGLDICQVPRGGGFCIHALFSRELMVVEDAEQDPRMKTSPLVTRPPHVRFYAGAPLITSDGVPLGTLCVLDYAPRALTPEQRDGLRRLARHVMVLFELRKNNDALRQAVAERDQAEWELRQIRQNLEQRVTERSTELLEANEHLRREAAEREREKNLLDELLDSLPGAFYVFDDHGHFLRWNRHFFNVLGYSDEEMADRHPPDFFAGDKPAVAAAIAKAFMEGEAEVVAHIIKRNGESLPYLFNGHRIEIDGKTYLCGMGVDISSQKRAEQRTAEAEQRYRMVAQLSPTAIFVIRDGRCVFANQGAARLLRSGSASELVGRALLDFLHPQCRDAFPVDAVFPERDWHGSPRTETRMLALDGSELDVEVASAPLRLNDVDAHIMVAHDITDSKRHQAQLQYQAHHDALTGLPNRALLIDRLEAMLARCERHGSQAHVIFFDLDNFKLINDSLGHHVGDELLKLVGSRMQECMRREDTLARLGGDEFVVAVADKTDREIAQFLLPRMIAAIGQPYLLGDKEIHPVCSIGISSYPADGEDVTTLLKRADMAMYRAKETGRNRFQFFTEDMNRKIDERLRLQSRLQRALQRGEFIVHYQPKVDLPSGRICGAEALLRWHPLGEEAVPPSKFIGLAEETGLIVPIGDWVMRAACAQSKEWEAHGLPAISIAVNCSPRQLLDPDFIERMHALLEETDIDPGRLEIEVTEGTIMQHPEEAIAILARMKELGLKLSVDDFGTGYSSLSYLKRFPIDRLKIDQSFVRDLPDDRDDAAIVEAVASLARSLGLRVTAEGVETAAQAEFLRQHCNDEAQGYYFSKPLPAADFAALLRAGAVAMH